MTSDVSFYLEHCSSEVHVKLLHTTLLIAVTAFVGTVTVTEVWAQARVPRESTRPIEFVTHIIDTGLTRGYQTVVADLNGDDRPDVIALSTRLSDLVWYENPGWQKHIIATDLSRMINMAAHDVDDDGVPEIALAHGFSSSYDQSSGIVSLLTHRGDPKQEWTIREIDRVPTTHRLRWVDFDGSGAMALVNAPLVGSASSAPDYSDDLSLLWYEPGDWRRRVMTDAERGVVHGIEVAPWGDVSREAVLSASFLGVHVHEFAGGSWVRTRVVDGDPASWPESGASEVQVGHAGSEHFLATIEPWHGHQVVVYESRAISNPSAWRRQVIDSTIEDGHTLVVADIDGDGRDEIVVGERRGRQSVYLYQLDADSTVNWSKQVLDDGDMAAAGCSVADLDENDRLDIICIGSSTANLKWYENVGTQTGSRGSR